MSHRTQVLPIKGGTFTGVCSCGWVGSDHPDRAGATQQTNLHKVTELRKAQKPEKQT